ncbi:metal ABC transporter solute-binding protein, Zn/Mn family [Mesobacillus selenatarsenatis]|uniref:Zinc ABC transporter, periplasmic-binding protein ZnuA n=1 Tax=Mesobacillus selenatarsenatis (strain DSM 18680 / JCM 14380 / FERM P-15431 / SF-1) TaxID=1321606 RepID=A0A0A8XB26_MESS1|nr:zinc ABC transporter substrate-binding protein [Mesobacillus selenatarsenatis]GAM16434.1 zinc ABC transporter, periplasmic-binding protein ZnuA [Mesobacillus selenatarsenatis SF-1]
MKKTAFILSLFMVIAAFLSGCGQDATDQEKNADLLQVYTTVYPLQFFAQQIGGDYVNVETVYPPGADEHTFEPSQKDMMALADADLFFYIGLGLEGFVDKASKTLKNEDVKMVPVSESLHLDENDEHQDEAHNEDGSAQEGHDEEGHDEEEHADEEHADKDGHDHGDLDPHVWLDPIYANELALAIKEQLAEKMPEHKDTFEQNYTELTAQLKDLDKEFSKVIGSAKRKEILVSHSAFSYWEERYGIQQISISGQSTTNEPSQKELQKLITHAKDEKIKYVLNEQNFNSKLAKMVQEEIGAKSLTLHNLSVLTDEDINNKETYFTLMEKNISTLEKALNE